MIKSFWKPVKSKSSKIKQSYWNNISKTPLWKQKNDDDKIGKSISDKEIEEKINKDRTQRAIRKDIKKYGREKAKEFWGDDIED